jgi:enoyl-CoA hydratase/carnithine racemase
MGKVKSDLANNILCITLCAPEKVNALDEEMIEQLLITLKKNRNNKECRVVVLAGEGENFSAGGDLDMVYQDLKNGIDVYGRDEFLVVSEIVQEILTYPKPVIAKVCGSVYGMSCNIALSCDLIIASEDAQFCQPFIHIGAIPDGGGIYILSKSIGINRAKELIFMGKPISANMAKDLGLISFVVKGENLEDESQRLAAKMSAAPTYAIAETKRVIFETMYQDFGAYSKLEQQAEANCAKSHDFIEGIEAFLNKRRPVFTGE